MHNLTSAEFTTQELMFSMAIKMLAPKLIVFSKDPGYSRPCRYARAAQLNKAVYHALAYI